MFSHAFSSHMEVKTCYQTWYRNHGRSLLLHERSGRQRRVIIQYIQVNTFEDPSWKRTGEEHVVLLASPLAYRCCSNIPASSPERRCQDNWYSTGCMPVDGRLQMYWSWSKLREGERDRERDRYRERECVCVRERERERGRWQLLAGLLPQACLGGSNTLTRIIYVCSRYHYTIWQNITKSH